MQINVIGATYVKASIIAKGGIIGRFVVEVDGLEVTSFYASQTSGTNSFLLVEGLDASVSHHVRLINILEPKFTKTDKY